MKVYIEGKQIELIDREVKDAKRLIKDLLDLILEKTGDAAPTYYFTCLIIMHIMSKTILQSAETANVAMVLNTYAKKINKMNQDKEVPKINKKESAALLNAHMPDPQKSAAGMYKEGTASRKPKPIVLDGETGKEEIEMDVF